MGDACCLARTVSSVPDHIANRWFMTGCELLAFVPTAWFQMAKEERSMKDIPWMQYAYLTLVLAITQGSGLSRRILAYCVFR